MDMLSEAGSARQASNAFRWSQLIIGVICMVMIANLQYGWTFFVPDIQKAFHWERAEIQIAFTLFVLFETWLVPIEGCKVAVLGEEAYAPPSFALPGFPHRHIRGVHSASWCGEADSARDWQFSLRERPPARESQK